jgi:hypothetical protein
MASNSWRPVFAALANETARSVYAEIVLGEDAPGNDLSPSRRRHALDALQSAGLIVASGDGWVAGTVFIDALKSAPAEPRAKGVERFLTKTGEIDRYPANLDERRELFLFIVEQSISREEVLDESEINERLSRFSADTAVLRRYLVDAELLERTASGSQYARV